MLVLATTTVEDWDTEAGPILAICDVFTKTRFWITHDYKIEVAAKDPDRVFLALSLVFRR